MIEWAAEYFRRRGSGENGNHFNEIRFQQKKDEVSLRRVKFYFETRDGVWSPHLAWESLKRKEL